MLGPTSSVVVRNVEREDPKDKEIAELKARIQQLEEAISVLQQSSK